MPRGHARNALDVWGQTDAKPRENLALGTVESRMSHATHILPAEPAAAARDTAGTITASIKMRSKHARASKAMALATFAMAAGSGLQALLYLRSFGVNARTDGFFAAFALYAIFGVFSQSIRVTSAPLLVGNRPAVSITQFSAALGLIAVPVIIITGPLAALLASVLAPSGGAASRDVMVEALPVLGGAMVVQLWAAGGQRCWPCATVSRRSRWHMQAVPLPG